MVKKILFLALGVVVALTLTSASIAGTECTGDKVAVASSDKDLPEGQSRVVIAVDGMTCGACATSIKKAVNKLDGIISIDVDHEGGSTTVVRVNDKVTVKEIVTAINMTGFKASEPTEG